MGPLDRAVWLCGGAGPMGQMHLVRTFALKIAGQTPNLKTVLLTDISDARLASVQERYAGMAKQAQVEFVTLNPNNPDYEQRLTGLAPEGFDFLVALCPVPPVIEAALKRLRQYGVVNLFAGFKRGEGALNMGEIHYDQITISGNSGSRIDDMKEVLRKVQAGRLNTNSSAYAVVGLEGAKEGVLWVRDGKAFNKILIYPQCKDLPLTPVADLADQLPFPAEVREEVRRGMWSNRAEEVLLASKWARRMSDQAAG
jgi:threonine dehydrogenase-like Zn-dependent dehydrogenase